MKKFLILFLCLTILSGCESVSFNSESTATETVSHTEITVNMPSDDSVNGYRKEGYVTSGMPDTIPIEDVKPSKPSYTSSTSEAYIGNSSSLIFHKPDCSSAKNMNDENKVTFKSRDEATAAGYKPCKRCSP